jgi:hypothetical protein
VLKRNFKLFILVIVGISYTLFTYKSIFYGKLLGEPFDSRLQIVLHEHWWRWFNGLVEFRDTEFFYPFDKALGFSDVFLTQGIVYSFFRFLGFDLAPSWSITTICLLLIGNLGWVFIAQKFLKNYILQIFAVLTFVSSLSFVYYFTLNPNIVGYSFISWFAIFAINISEEKNLSVKNQKISNFITLLLVYALSCWYAAFFIGLVFTARLFLEIVLYPKKFIFIQSQNNFLKLAKQYFLQSPIQLFLIWLFVYVYVSVANDLTGSVDNLLKNSPRVRYLVNGSNVDGTGLSGAYFKQLYLSLGFNFDKEYGIGIGIFSSLFGVISLVYLIYKRLFSLNQFLWLCAVAIGYFYFHIWFNQYSLHKFFFELIPGFDSIRYPARYVILVGFSVIFLIFFTLDKLANNANYKKKTLVLLIGFLILVDQYRSSFKGWNSSTLVNLELMAQKQDIINSCDYFYYDYPGGWWHEQIEAMMFSIQIGVPTVNGYSGSFPPRYPSESFNSSTEPVQIFRWINEIAPEKRGCLVTGRTKIKSLTSNSESVEFVGFTGEEKKGSATWRWANSASPYLYIYSRENNLRNLKFNLRTSSCFKNQIISITDSQNNLLFKDTIVNEEKNYDLKVDLSNKFIKIIQFNTDAQVCKVKGDPRDLYFEIKNFSIS